MCLTRDFTISTKSLQVDIIKKNVFNMPSRVYQKNFSQHQTHFYYTFPSKIMRRKYLKYAKTYEDITKYKDSSTTYFIMDFNFLLT